MNNSWFLRRRASSHLLCAFMSFHFCPCSPYFASALILSVSSFFLSTVHWNIPLWSIRLHKSTAVKNRKGERDWESTEKWEVTCYCTFPLLHYCSLLSPLLHPPTHTHTNTHASKYFLISNYSVTSRLLIQMLESQFTWLQVGPFVCKINIHREANKGF